MAQVCGHSSFDHLWNRQHDAALGVLRKAADVWTCGRVDAVSLDALVAVLLRIYLSEWPEFGGIISETRDLESWLQLVTTARQELESLRPRADSSIVERLVEELSFAVRQWLLGDPESPPTTRAINAVESVLFSGKLTRRPASPNMPASLLHHESPSSAS
jgi:hypothetical protein